MEIEVFACNDGLEAKVAISGFNQKEWENQFPGQNKLLSHLLSYGLVPDMVEKAVIETIFAQLDEGARDPGLLALNLKEVQALTLASGVPPEHEEAVGLMFHKSYVSEREDLENLEGKLREHPFEEAKKNLDPSCLVDAGQCIVSFMSIRRGKPGVDVFGKPIPYRAYTDFLPDAGHGIVKLEKKWAASVAGVLVLRDNVLEILRETGSQPGLIRISEDKQKAWLLLEKDVMLHHDDVSKGIEALQGAMAKMGLRPLRDVGTVRTTLEAYLLDGREREVLLLEGLLPKPGKDGVVKLLLNPEPDLPDPDSVLKMDFKAFTFFRAVSKGEPLAQIIPPEPGTGGIDVFGNITLPKPGNPIQLKPARNTEYAPNDPNLLIASRDGRLSVEDGIPYVVETLKVPHDVSFKTGNLTFPGSVEVEGDVHDKFAIEAKGDVGIGGVVENGRVISDGAIIIKGGVIGGGSGLIKSKLSSVTIGFIRNQRIESHSNIVVYNEVLNSQLLARKSILMKSSSHSVIGGSMVAFDAIEIFNAGNEAGTKTILEVGKDFEVEAELLRKQEYLKSVRADLEFLEKKRDQLELIVRWEAGKKPESRLLEQRVKGVATFLEKVRQGLNAKLNSLEASLYNPGNCHISVSGIAYPGTVLKYQDKVVPINEPMRNKRWIFKGS